MRGGVSEPGSPTPLKRMPQSIGSTAAAAWVIRHKFIRAKSVVVCPVAVELIAVSESCTAFDHRDHIDKPFVIARCHVGLDPQDYQVLPTSCFRCELSFEAPVNNFFIIGTHINTDDDARFR
jgi:hypothetical protein